jgi:hypothetical protein
MMSISRPDVAQQRGVDRVNHARRAAARELDYTRFFNRMGGREVRPQAIHPYRRIAVPYRCAVSQWRSDLDQFGQSEEFNRLRDATEGMKTDRGQTRRATRCDRIRNKNWTCQRSA